MSKGQHSGNGRRCVVIGSGIGGLSCAAALAGTGGWRVTVLEAGTVAGGCLQCFTRGGVKFETGMHFVGSAARGETLDRLLRWLDVRDDLTLTRLDPDGYDVISLAGQRYRFANGSEAFVETLAADFPHERDHLMRYCELVAQVAGASSLHSLRHVESDAAMNTQYQLRSIDEVLAEVTGDERLRRVLAGNIPLLAAERGKTPFAAHAFITDFYNRSAWRVAGGSDAIAQALVASVRRRGGEVLTGKRVTHIDVGYRGVKGVTTADGDHYEADTVIAAIHPARLVELTDTPLLRPAYRQRVQSLPETVGGFTIYLSFKPGEVPYMNHNFYGYAQDTPWDCERYTADNWPLGYLYMHMSEGEGQRYARSGVILSYMRWEEVSRWLGTRPGRRGADYEEMKREHAERLLRLVERDHPGLRNHIAATYTSTPLTYRDYTGTERGSMYGIAKDIALGPACRVHHRTRVPGLLLAGQNINSHGILGVLVGTMVTCTELLGPGVIFRQLMEEGTA